MDYLVEKDFYFKGKEYKKNTIFSYPFSRNVRKLLNQGVIKPKGPTLNFAISENREKSVKR